MTKRLAGRIAIITGASKGIGAAIAKDFAREGAAVVVNYASSRADADRVVEAIAAEGGKAVAAQADVSKIDDIERLFETAARELGAPDIIVNNAGVFAFVATENITVEDYRREFDTNVLGVVMMIKTSLKYFGPAGGSVINISSVASENPTPNQLLYSASKAAVDSVTRSLARELGPRKIRVNTIAPGGTNTEGVRSAGLLGGEFEKLAISMTPLGRVGLPDDIAKVASFLASDDAGWITGERLTVSGGFR